MPQYHRFMSYSVSVNNVQLRRFPLDGILFTYLVLEATSFVVYLLSYLVSEAISSLRDIFSYLSLGAVSFVRHKLKYYTLESIGFAATLFYSNSVSFQKIGECY